MSSRYNMFVTFDVEIFVKFGNLIYCVRVGSDECTELEEVGCLPGIEEH